MIATPAVHVVWSVQTTKAIVHAQCNWNLENDSEHERPGLGLPGKIIATYLRHMGVGQTLRETRPGSGLRPLMSLEAARPLRNSPECMMNP